MSVATEITRLSDAKADLKRAINAKGGTLVNERLSEYASAVDALLPEDFGNRIRFIDYDGTVLKTMFIAEGESAEPPTPPEHPGMVFQGWNCEYNNISGHRDIGAIYTTESGAAEFDVRVEIPTGLTVTFYPYIESGTLHIDWGNGSSDEITETGKQTVSFTYADYGTYTIKMKISDGGSWYIPDHFCQGSSGNYYLIAARIAGIRQISSYAFQYKYGLRTITFDRTLETMGEQIFYECRSLVAIVFPDSLTSIGRYSMQYCYGLSRIVFPDSITIIPEQICYNCHVLDGVTIPDGVERIDYGAFQYCHSLSYVHFPDTLTNIREYAFRYCYPLHDLRLPDNLTNLGEYAFNECFGIEEVRLPGSITSCGGYVFHTCRNLRKITIPENWTSIPNGLCYRCYALESIEIPERITYIGDEAFYECYRLTEVKFHADIATIRSGAFRYCRAMRDYYCYRETPPTLSSSNVFNDIPGSCIIWVPASTDRTVLTAYKTASNWSNYANYMKEMEI